MSFPPQPRTDDERRTELLRLMEVPGCPRLYVLGCFAQYVTVYAQQVRAFNLVDTLAKSGYLTSSSEVAVIGGGIAGLTTAAAAAVRGVQSVSVFEKEGNTMRLQRGTEKRFIHPHIYDWPAEGALNEKAGHDLLDWEAKIAADVVKELDQQWEELREKFPALRPPRLGCGDLDVKSDGKRWTVLVEDKPAGTFDVVILAVGFGRDSTPSSEGYWTDTSLDGLEAESAGTWFVSGYGDGGLTDLMRLCIMDFRHKDVLNAVDQATRQIVGDDLLAAEQPDAQPEDLVEVFRKAARKIKPDLDARLRPRTLGKVWLNCPTFPALFSGNSSLLNRLIVAYLSLDNRFDLVPGGGKLKTIQKTPDGKDQITFENGREPLEVDRVVLRHGPSKALTTDFAWVADRCPGLEQEWKSNRQHGDWTREPLYAPGDFRPDSLSQQRLRVDFRQQIGCLVITGSRTPAGQTQSQRIAGALENLRALFRDGRFMGREIAGEPEHIPTVEALASSAAYERTVRALCDSDIAVFDITGFESTVMLFLGIRSAVRRGITLTISQDDAGRLLPFNLTALNPIRLGADEEQEDITNALETGLASLRDQPEAYLDLPAFDAVRHLGKEYRPQPPKEQILVLRWFDKQYHRLVRDLTKNAVIEIAGAKPPVVTTLDSSSPQLVSQRLYAAIRRTQLCVADWTGWRPNVFFEIGVRLAVNRIDPVFILCKEQPPGWKDEPGVSEWPTQDDPHAETLKAFFDPVLFTFQGGYGPIRERIQKHLAQGIRGSKLSPGRTFQVICESIHHELEPGGKRVEEMLLGEATRIAGPAGPEEGGFPLLYSDVLADQARRSSVEMLLAAWHYLDRRDAHGGLGLMDRLKAGTLKPGDPILEPLNKVGQELSARLRNVQGNEYLGIDAEIKEALAMMETVEDDEAGQTP